MPLDKFYSRMIKDDTISSSNEYLKLNLDLIKKYKLDVNELI